MTTDTQVLPQDVLDTICRTVENEDYLSDAGRIVGETLLQDGHDATVFFEARRELWRVVIDSGYGDGGATQAVHGLSAGYGVDEVGRFQWPATQAHDGDHRTTPGEGENVWIYVVGTAQDHADSIVPAFGEISAGCGPNLGEDFAKCIWPVTLKVKMGVSDQQLVQHLRDLADLIELCPGRRTEAARETANIIPF